LTCLLLYFVIADGEQGSTSADSENLVVGMNVPARPVTNLVSRKGEDRNISADVFAFE